MRVYKLLRVVRYTDGRKEYLSSYIANKYTIQYKPGEWIEPKIGKIFCFKDKDIAYPFHGYELWEAEAVISDIKCKKLIHPLLAESDASLIETFWNKKLWISENILKNKTSISYNIEPIPSGIILADKIKIIKKVSWDVEK